MRRTWYPQDYAYNGNMMLLRDSDRQEKCKRVVCAFAVLRSDPIDSSQKKPLYTQAERPPLTESKK